MKQMMLVGTGIVRWQETPEPVLSSPGGAIVRPIAVATCDLDVGVLRGGFPLQGPYPFGHEGVAEVIAVGDEVRSFAPGDIVVVPFQISCGACDSCFRGRTGNCRAHPKMSTFGLGTMGGLNWGGLLADLALVPHADAMLVKVPSGVSAAAAASASDNMPDAFRCVAPQLAADPGAEVLIVGGNAGPNSIGLYAVGLALALGASRVVYADDNRERLEIAERFGAQIMEGIAPRKVGSFGITVDASGNATGLQCALNSTAFDGFCTSPSVYLSDPEIPMFLMYLRCCTLHAGRAHVRPAIPQVLDLIASGFDPTIVTSAVVPWSDAEVALSDPPLKLVLERS